MKSLIPKVSVGWAGPSGPGYNINLELILLWLVVIFFYLGWTRRWVPNQILG